MKPILSLLTVLLIVPPVAIGATESAPVALALADPAAASLAKPTPGQIEWADMECEMFAHFGVATWKGSEYDDNGQMDLSKMNPKDFDPQQICDVAKSWGAKQLILVCKHVGGFCWWPTETTDYCVKNIPWKNGQGNLVNDMADALRKNGLKMGIYIYSDDTRYAKGIGRGGRTDDPAKQEEWNRKLRQQWTEVLTICGPDLVREIWFDGGCIVPLEDIIRKLAPRAEIFGGPLATVRWPGTESGKLPYPCWSTGSGDAGDPNAKGWLPPECDTVLYGRGGHNWFWSPKNESRRNTLDDLMDVYLKSVGRCGVLLLNSSPNIEGRIPAADVERYREFGAEIQRRFGSPLATTSGVGATVELELGGLRKVNQSWIMEDTRGGHRIRAYVLEGRGADGKWLTLADGISVGHKRIDVFETTLVDRLRLRITKNVGTPIIRELAAFHADGVSAEQRSLTRGRPTTASSTHSDPYAPDKATDGDDATRWSAKDADVTPWLEVDFGHPTTFGEVAIRELAHRIQAFVIEYRDDISAPWMTAFTGGSVGDDYKRSFPRVTGRFVRLRVVKGGSLGPTLWEFSVYPGWEEAAPCGNWKVGAERVTFDLTRHIRMPATYEVALAPEGKTRINSAKLLFNGVEMPAEDCVIQDGKVIVRQTQQVTEQTRTELELGFASGASAGHATIRVVSER